MSDLNVPRVAIVGGGLGGLVLARILHINNVDSVVYERDDTRDSRDQGGSLDIHADSGQVALREAGLEAAFRSIIRPGGQDMRVLDKTGAVLWDEAEEDGDMGRPEVDRTVLRALLLDALDPQRVRFGHNLAGLDAINGGYRLRFENGATAEAAIVIGADGAWSRVRPAVSDARPTYAGVSFIEVGVPNAEREHPELLKLVGRGSMFALADKKGLMTHVTGNGRIHAYVAFRVAEDWLSASGIPFEKPAEARAAILSHFTEWSPGLRALIRECDDMIFPRRLYALPSEHHWQARRGLTLLGDAAHLMSPFAGEGANLAMLDAAELALALAETRGVDAAIRRYEAPMFERAHEMARDSAGNMELCMATDGARRLADRMASMHRQIGTS